MRDYRYLRPKGERDQLPSQILSPVDMKARNGAHNARDADTETYQLEFVSHLEETDGISLQ